MDNSQPTLETQLEAARQGMLVLDLGAIVAFRITGADSVRYLHGRVTQDIKNLPVGLGKQALVLTPQGKIQAHVLLLRATDSFTVLGDPRLEISNSPAVAQALLQFRVSDDVQLEDNSGMLRLLRLIGPQTDRMMAAHRIDPIGKDPLTHRKIFFPILDTSLPIIRRQFDGIPALDILLPAQSDSVVSELLGAMQDLAPKPVIGDIHGHDVLRIISGMPQFGLDITEKTSGPDLPAHDLIAFDKGCYTGQEVVEMATARGKPQRKLVRIEAGAPLTAPGSLEISSDNSTWSRCGEITSTAYLPNERRAFALGFVKFDTDCAQHFRSSDTSVVLREIAPHG